jgi:hypothetical protein
MSQWPIGTPEELRELGIDPSSVRSCSRANSLEHNINNVLDADPSKLPGCEFWEREDWNGNKMRCMFAKDCGKVKAFRGSGPKNVAVFITLDKAETVPGQLRPATFVRFMPCFLFEATMRGRYENQLKNGERIGIMGVEGDGKKYKQKVHRVVPSPGDPKIMTVEATEELQSVPSFPRPKDQFPDVAMEQELANEMENQREQEIENAMAEHIAEIGGTFQHETEASKPEKKK